MRGGPPATLPPTRAAGVFHRLYSREKVIILMVLGVFLVIIGYTTFEIHQTTTLDSFPGAFHVPVTHSLRNSKPNKEPVIISTDPRVITVFNHLGFDISLFFDNSNDVGISNSGELLGIIPSKEEFKISASNGQTFYVTEVDDYENKKSMFVIRYNSDAYNIGSPLTISAHDRLGKNMQLNVEYKNRTYPKIFFLNSNAEHNAMAAKFRNLSNKKIEFFYDDGRDGVPQGQLKSGHETTTATYVGHQFYFKEVGKKSVEIARFVMKADQSLYIIYDPQNPAEQSFLDISNREIDFNDEYYKRNGMMWRHFYGTNGPRPPPSLYQKKKKKIGQVHRVTSTEGYWSCDGLEVECKSKEKVTLHLEVVSLAPRVFMIENFLSDFEVDEIVKHARPRLHHSSVGDVDTGAFESDTRTSTNTWIARTHSAITETLFLRASDLLQIDEKLLDRHKNAEDMQVVHYTKGQRYDSHHDWGVSGYPESRFITLLLYLTDMPDGNSGGETSFPKGAGGKGFKIHPGKGNAVLFYNLLEDGNGDDLALHAALPVKNGEKWLANFWVWDPKFKD